VVALPANLTFSHGVADMLRSLDSVRKQVSGDGEKLVWQNPMESTDSNFDDEHTANGSADARIPNVKLAKLRTVDCRASGGGAMSLCACITMLCGHTSERIYVSCEMPILPGTPKTSTAVCYSAPHFERECQNGHESKPDGQCGQHKWAAETDAENHTPGGAGTDDDPSYVMLRPYADDPDLQSPEQLLDATRRESAQAESDDATTIYRRRSRHDEHKS
jgi:hypothetical protein